MRTDAGKSYAELPSPLQRCTTREAPHHSTRVDDVRVAIVCKADFAAHSIFYGPKSQRSRTPESCAQTSRRVMQRFLRCHVYQHVLIAPMNKSHFSKYYFLVLLFTFTSSMGQTLPSNNSSDPAEKPVIAKKTFPGMDAEGNVVDSALVVEGSGKIVKGLNDWEGEIVGNPIPNSRFTQLQIGMTMKQAIDIVGQPTDEGTKFTGKAWIPFYLGADRYRVEMAFKGQGRLIFAGGSAGQYTGGNLVWIIHNPKDSGYR